MLPTLQTLTSWILLHPFTTIFFLSLVIVLLKGVYNRYFHPLRSFPGPFWGSITDLNFLYIIATKQCHTIGLKHHKLYGPIVRIAPNFLIFSDPKFLPVVYHRYADKTPFYTPGVMGEVSSFFQTLDHAEHNMKRKRVALPLSVINLRRIEFQIDERVLELEQIFLRDFAGTGKPLDFAKWAQWYSFDVISQLSSGKPFGFMKNGYDVGGLAAAFQDMAPLAGLIASLPSIMGPLLRNPVSKRFLAPKAGDGSGSGRLMEFRDNLLSERLRNPPATKHQDLIDYIIHAKNPGGGPISRKEMEVESFSLTVGAAFQTTAGFLSPFVHYVADTPHIYAKLMAEIEDFERSGKLSSPVPMFVETLEMPYFMACIKETLRFSPPIPIVLPRMVSKGGVVLNNHTIPEGTEIGANAYVIHRDQSIYGEDANVFRPERWLIEDSAAQAMEKYNLAWGYGARACGGKKIGQMETQKLCLQLFRKFRIRSATPNNPWRNENWAISIYFDQLLYVDELNH